MADKKIEFEVKATTDQAVQAMNKVEMSVEQINKAFKEVQQQSGNTLKSWKDFHNMSDMAGSSKRWADYKRQVVEAKDASGMFIKTTEDQTIALQRLNETTRRGAMVGLSFNRIIQDAGYFGQSAAMGFMAVGNNITYFAEQLSFAKQQGLSMTGVLKGMLTGVNAWMFAINLAVSAITFFTISQWRSKDAVDENTKSIKKQKETLEDYINNILEPERKRQQVAFFDTQLFGDQAKLESKKNSLIAAINGISFAIAEAKKEGNLSDIFGLTMQKQALEVQLKPIEEKLKAINILWTEQKEVIKKLIDEQNKEKDAAQKILDVFTPLQQAIADIFSDTQNKLIKEQADQLFRIAEVWGKMPKFGEVAGGLIIPNQNIGTNFQKPDTAKFLQDYEDKKAKKDADLYKSTLREFSSIGSNLRTIFKDAGDSFLNSMIESLSVVTAILEIVQSIQAIMTFLDLLKTAASVAAAPATGGGSLLANPIWNPSRSMVGGGGTIVIPVSIGDKLLQTIIVDTTKKAQRLRYL